MCVTSKGRILEIDGKIAKVEINGKILDIRIDLVNAKIGEYVYCAAGMAVEKVGA